MDRPLLADRLVGRELFEPNGVIPVETALVVVNEDGIRDVHSVYKNDALLNSAEASLGTCPFMPQNILPGIEVLHVTWKGYNACVACNGSLVQAMSFETIHRIVSAYKYVPK